MDAKDDAAVAVGGSFRAGPDRGFELVLGNGSVRLGSIK